MTQEVFSLEQADRMVSVIRPMLEDARKLKREIESIAAKASYNLAELERPENKKRVDELARRLGQAIEAMEEQGVYVRDLDVGIVEFLSFFDGEEIFFCHKLGEERILRFHSVRSGCGQSQEVVDLEARDRRDRIVKGEDVDDGELKPEAKAEIERRIKRLLSGQEKTFTTDEVKEELFGKKNKTR